MASGVKVKGVKETIFALERLSERTNAAMLKVARDGANEISKSAKLNAPIDTGDLERAITVTADPVGINRRYVFHIGVDEGQILNVHEADYYVQLHEHMERLGPRSSLKNISVKALPGPEYVGDQYLKRAADQHAPSIYEKAQKIVKELIK